MLERILRFSIEHRCAVVLAVARSRCSAATRSRDLPIDAVPDITNNQVQINTLAPSLSPVEVEKQVTFPIETALAGIPGLRHTRARSRATASRRSRRSSTTTSTSTSRASRSAERLGRGAREPARRRRAAHGPDLDRPRRDLHVDRRVRASRRRGRRADGGRAGLAAGRLLSHARRRAPANATSSRPPICGRSQDWIIRPQLKSVPDVAGVDAIGGYVKQYHVQPDPRKLVAYGLTFHDVIEALERNNVSTGAGYIEHNGEAYLVRATGRIERPEQIGAIVVGERARHADLRARRRVGRHRPRAAHGQRERERRGGRRRHGADADRREQPHRRRRRRREDGGGRTGRFRRTSAPRPCSTARSSSTRRSPPCRRTSSRARSS